MINKKNKQIIISDLSLRDGNHAVSQKLSKSQIIEYCQQINQTGVPIIEVGHGNGLGASSLQLGESAISDIEMISCAKKNLSNAKLSVHIIPGVATIERNLKPAMDAGVDIFRIASHCTEADITQPYIQYVRSQGKEAYGVLMMSHLISSNKLLAQALKMESYGAQALIFMDSAGYYIPNDVKIRVKKLVKNLSIPIGFHGHNNLNLAIANSIAAVDSGASILDATINGFGAGAGNTQLEVLVAVLKKCGYDTNIDLYQILDLATWAEKHLLKEIPVTKPNSIISGLSGVFSGFLKPVQKIAKEYALDPRDIFVKLGKQKVIAGQEDMILKIARSLSKRK